MTLHEILSTNTKIEREFSGEREGGKGDRTWIISSAKAEEQASLILKRKS